MTGRRRRRRHCQLQTDKEGADTLDACAQKSMEVCVMAEWKNLLSNTHMRPD